MHLASIVSLCCGLAHAIYSTEPSIKSHLVPSCQTIQQELHGEKALVLQVQSILEDSVLKGKHRPVHVLQVKPRRDVVNMGIWSNRPWPWPQILTFCFMTKKT